LTRQSNLLEQQSGTLAVFFLSQFLHFPLVKVNNFLMIQTPNPNILHPLDFHKRLCFLKNLVQNPNIIVGDYTYYDDFEDVHNFEKNVKYHFDFTGDKLIIGKFCMIASGAQFIMNGGNHLSEAISAYPFAIFGGDWGHAMEDKQYPNKGDIVIGNDVWIGHNAVIMPGVRIGDGAIIGSYAIVTRDVEPYTIVGGNPAREIRKRFSPEEIEILLELKWWDWEVEKITRFVKWLTTGDVDGLMAALMAL
jgi:virginiamycin A acetyltransferase